MCLGSGGSQTTTQEFKPPGYTQPGWESYVQAGQTLSQTPYQQSYLPTVAPINDYQATAGQLAYDRALYGAPDINAARGAAMNAAQGNYSNPYAQNVQGIASGQAYNPWSEGVYDTYSQAGSNPYLAALGGSIGATNPYASDEYTNQILNNNAQQMAKAYSVGGAAQNDAAAAMQGAYGGSAYQEMKDRGEASLAGQIGQMASQVQQQQQQYKGQIFDQDQQRMLQGLGMGMSGYQSGIGQQLAALGLGSQNYMGDVQNQLAGNAQGGGMWQNDIGNILSGAGLAGQLSQDDYRAMQGLQDTGNNWNSYYQKLLDSLNNQYNTQNQYDFNMNDYFGNVLSRASGTGSTSSITQPGQSTLAGLLGLGATGAGLYSLYRG